MGEVLVLELMHHCKFKYCLLLQSVRHHIYVYMLLQYANVMLQNGKRVVRTRGFVV